MGFKSHFEKQRPEGSPQMLQQRMDHQLRKDPLVLRHCLQMANWQSRKTTGKPHQTTGPQRNYTSGCIPLLPLARVA